MDNKQIADVFDEIGDILEIKGVNFFRVNAYRKAALTINNLAEDLRQVVEKTPTELSRIPGIGQALKDKIVELVKTGKCQEHERLKEGFPEGLLEMLKLRGVGPKKVKLFYSELNITTLAALKDAAERGLLRELPKMGEKSESEILKAIEERENFSIERRYIHEATQEADAYINYMKNLKEIKKIQYAGSLRRCKETIGDIDILLTVEDPEKVREKVMRHFVEYPEVRKIVAEGDTKSSVVLGSGLDVDLRVVAEESFGAALHYFTGSKEHNIKMRDIAKNKGLKLNEYGLMDGDKIVAGESEEAIFEELGLPFIPPEMRRNDGEIEYAQKHGKVPKLVELSDIRGDLHNHSNYSDGKNSLLEVAESFIERGYEYFAMTDHSKVMAVTNGLDKEKIERQWAEIDEVQEQLGDKIKILKGCEVDILKDGSLDFEDEVLSKLEIVVISAHLFHSLPADEQTKRLISAIENPHSMILGHPTGRLINKRSPMQYDMQKVIDACVENDVALEINSNPHRLDLAEKYLRIAKDKGAKFAIDTDSHSIHNHDFMSFGVGMARRGWLEGCDVINTWPLAELTAYSQKV